MLLKQQKRQFAAPLKKPWHFCEKNCGFVDSEFSKICHEQVHSYYLSNIKAILRGFVGSLNKQKFTRLGINQISQELKVIYLHIYIF